MNVHAGLMNYCIVSASDGEVSQLRVADVGVLIIILAAEPAYFQCDQMRPVLIISKLLDFSSRGGNL
jgi:hypothetical protein